MKNSPICHAFIGFLALASFCVAEEPHLAASGAPIEVSTRADLIAAVEKAAPGTTILVASGEYRGGLTFEDLQGTDEKPIVIAGKSSKEPPVLVGRTSGIHLVRPAFVELRDIVLRGATGNGINIDDGGEKDSPVRGIVLKRLTVEDVGPQGNHDGIKLSGLTDFRIENCSISRWGESGSGIDMVGCHRGTIVGCRLSYRSDVLGSGVQAKGGTSEVTIRHCRFDRAGNRAINIGGHTGKTYFRPKDAPHEAKDITVEDCTFVGSMSPIAFVGVDGATVRYNTIYRPERWVFRILQENRGPGFVSCRDGLFSHNLIAYNAAEIHRIANVGSGTQPATFRIEGNHWFCIDAPEQSDRLDLPVAESGGHYGTDPKFRNAPEEDLRLLEASPVKNAGARIER